MSATLHGTVAFQGTEANINVVLRFFTPNTTTELFKACAPVPSGTFTVYGITPGTYDIGIKSGGYLSVLVEDKVFTEGNTTEVDFGSLLGGDIKGNDRCQLADYTMALNNQGVNGACYTGGYGGDWFMPDWPTAAAGGGASYKLIGGQNI